MKKGYCLCALFSLMVVAISYCQETHIEDFENGIFKVQDMNLGAEIMGKNIFSAQISNLTESTKNLAIDIRTECLGFGIANQQRQSYYRLQGHESRKIRFEYEIASPLIGRIILRLGESEKYLDMDKWRSLGHAEQMKNLPPDAKYFWRKVFYHKLSPEQEKTINDLTSAHDICLETLSSEKISQMKMELPVQIEKARKEENPLRKKLSQLLRIDRECPQDYGFREEKWDERFSYLNQIFDNYNIKAEVFSIAADAGNRINAFFVSRTKDSQEKKPLIILLSGNPPGIKESLVSGAAYFAVLGYHAIGIDRRPSARILDKKEKFLDNHSDPVFDTLRLVNFLQSQTRYKISNIGIWGFSAGAGEAKFVAALDSRIKAVALACGITSHDWLFKDVAWVPTFSGMIIFPELGLGNPDIGHLTSQQFQENFAKVKSEDNPRARKIFNEVFPYFEDLDSLRVVPLIAPVPLLIITGTQDDQFSILGVVEVDSAVEEEYKKYGLVSCSEFYPEPRTGHWINSKAGYIIGSFFKRWLN